MLVVDHVTPVASGGTNDILNLVTSCEACNAGKAAKSLSAAPLRPDADLLYMKTQQEIAELRRFHKAQEELTAVRDELVEHFLEQWDQHSWHDAPDKGTLLMLLSKGSPDNALKALITTAHAMNDRRVTRYNAPKYLWKVFWNMEREDGRFDDAD